MGPQKWEIKLQTESGTKIVQCENKAIATELQCVPQREGVLQLKFYFEQIQCKTGQGRPCCVLFLKLKLKELPHLNISVTIIKQLCLENMIIRELTVSFRRQQILFSQLLDFAWRFSLLLAFYNTIIFFPFVFASAKSLQNS